MKVLLKVGRLEGEGNVSGTFSGELKYVESSGYITGGNFSGIKKITFRDSPTFTLEKGINGSGILGLL